MAGYEKRAPRDTRGGGRGRHPGQSRPYARLRTKCVTNRVWRGLNRLQTKTAVPVSDRLETRVLGGGPGEGSSGSGNGVSNRLQTSSGLFSVHLYQRTERLRYTLLLRGRSYVHVHVHVPVMHVHVVEL